VTDTRPAVPAPVELRARIVSAVIIIPAVVIAVLAGARLFAVIVAIAAILALREWHRLVNGNLDARETIPSSIAIIAALLVMWSGGSPLWPFLVLLLGALVTALSAGMRRAWVLWHGVGVLYIGIPTLALVALHGERNGLVVGGLFAAVWAADTAALFTGRILGGPRLAPTLSPNKTWAGFVGGLIAAGIAEIIYVALAGSYLGTGTGALLRSAAFGIFVGIAAACGDLFESWVKRRCRAKNSGSLIPGHGGVLDRIDSLLFAAPAAAALLYLTRVDLFGAVP
jgi:phosphatidate cytidylyltransferase